MRVLPPLLLLLAAAPVRAETSAPPRLAAPDLRVRAPEPLLALAEGDGSSMDFDLLGEPAKPPPQVDARALRLRRTMLKTHQAMGLGLFGLQLATTVVGQLNWSDKFAGGPNTAKYQQPHAILAYTNLAAFVATGAVALLAPAAQGARSGGFDRVTLHKVSMFTAAAGMLAQGALGIYTARREGYQNQERIGTIHLAIGYATFAALAAGVGAIAL
jgi:hypothetical protein